MGFDPERLVGLDSTHSTYFATLVLKDEVGASVIACSMIQNWKVLGVLDESDSVTVVHNEGVLVFFVEVPLFDVVDHLGVN